MEEKLRVGVIGVGRLGQHHARLYAANPRCELVGVADVDEATAARIARANDTEPFRDHRDLIGRVDAVSVVVPTSSHHPVAMDFLGANVHVLVEKPIANNVDEARDLIDLARERGLTLQVGHIERFNAAITKLRDILTRPRFIEIHRLGPYDPRVQDVGVVLDLMIHDLDILMQVVRSPIEDVQAVGAPILSDKEDIANARIRFANGCIANLTASRVTPQQMRKIRIFQDDAYLAIDYDRQSMEVYRRVELPLTKGGPKAEIRRRRMRLDNPNKLELEIDHFLNCVAKGEQPMVDGEQGAAALELAVRISEMVRKSVHAYLEQT